MEIITGVKSVVRSDKDNDYRKWRGTRDGAGITQDWKQALANEGRAFHIQLGTEDAPINSTTSIDDALVWAVVDVPDGTTILPYHAEAVIATWTTGALVNMMIEIDRLKARYTSGGTAFTPLNLRTNFSSITSGCSAYVGTDITTAAKSADNSIETGRQSVEVNLGDAADAVPAWKYDPAVIAPVVGPASVLFHLGAGTADVTAYGELDYFEIPSDDLD